MLKKIFSSIGVIVVKWDAILLNELFSGIELYHSARNNAKIDRRIE